MNSSRRRMVLQKYSNRPPFDLKKKEAINKHFRKSFQHVEQSFKTIMNHLDALQSDYDIDPEEKIQLKASPKLKRNLAPKIIETFRKATPKRVPTYKNSKKFSGKIPKKSVAKAEIKEDVPVETLYRNRHLEFGRNIPNHKIMKELLQNFDASSLSVCINGRINKATSTTGIVWPLQEDPPVEKVQKRPDLKSKSKISKKHRKTPKEFVFTEDHIQDERRSKRFSKNTRCLLSSKPSICEKNDVAPNDGVDRRKKNKSFVKSQVEKFQTMLCTKNKNSKHRQSKQFKTKNTCSNYLEMMNSVKNEYPVLEPKTEVSNSEHYGWSSATEKKPSQHETDEFEVITFPKETKNAMELMILDPKKYTRTPLAKYLKVIKPLSIQPAISVNYISDVKNNFPDKILNAVDSSPCCKDYCYEAERCRNRMQSTKVPFPKNSVKKCVQNSKGSR